MHQRIVRRQRLELVGRGDEGKAGQVGDLGRDRDIEPLGRVEAGADRGAALRELHHPVRRRLDPLTRQNQLRGIARKLLPQGERRRVLQMGAADLHDIVPRRDLRADRISQSLERRIEPVRYRSCRRDVERRREAVVR